MYEGLCAASLVTTIEELDTEKDKWMSEVRKHFMPKIKEMTRRIDEASQSYVMTGDVVHLTHYNKLVKEMIELKESIIEMEDGAVR